MGKVRVEWFSRVYLFICGAGIRAECSPCSPSFHGVSGGQLSGGKEDLLPLKVLPSPGSRKVQKGTDYEEMKIL